MEQAPVILEPKVNEFWQNLLDKLEQACTQGLYHVLYANLKVVLALLQNIHFQHQLTLTASTIESIHRYLSTLGHAADEATFRKELHLKFAKPFYKIISVFYPEQTPILKQAFKDNILSIDPRFDYTPFNKKVVSEQENKLEILKLTFKKAQKEKVEKLKNLPSHNCYKVFLDTLVPYVKEFIDHLSPMDNLPAVNADYIHQLLTLLEDGWYIKHTQVSGSKLLWHSLLALQNTLDTDRVTHFVPEFAALHFNSSELSTFTYAKCVLALQAMAQGIKPADELAKVLDVVQGIMILNERLAQLTLTPARCELLKDQQLQLQRMRLVFEKSEDPIAAQKQFSADTLVFLNNMLQACVSLLGEPPIDMALCALGSSSRTDRRPYSDIELILLYQQPEPKEHSLNKHRQYLKDWRVKLYLYHLLGLFELAIVKLGESDIKVPHSKEKGAGFHLDTTCHILDKELFGTTHHMVTMHITEVIQARDTTTPMQNHPWYNGESFFALLQPKLINTHNFYGSQEIIKAYDTAVQSFLDAIPTPVDEVAVLQTFLKLKANVNLCNLKRRELIALSTLQHVLEKSAHYFNCNIGETVEVKVAFYKPLTYLALSLKLFYNLTAEHPVDIFDMVSQQLGWGQTAVLSLFKAALAFIAQLQNKLHQQAQQQEEYIIWLGSAAVNILPYQILAPIEYAILDLIQHSLIEPLANLLKSYYEKPRAEFKDLLHVLFKSHLNYRNLTWVQKWTQHPTHAVTFKALVAHPLINVLADYPSPDGWSPTYEQTMRRWLGQLQTITTDHRTSCLIEGIPTLDPQKTSYLPQEIVAQLFDTKGEFKGKVHDSAQSKVSQVSWPTSDPANAKVFYFKVKPGNEAGLMGREFAVINLHQLLGGPSHIALGWPLKLTYMTAQGSKVYYCWVSEGVTGKSLAEVMQAETDFDHFQNQVDMQSYSHLFITHYLTCPEDAQPENFKVDSTPKDTFRLYGLDVGQSFVGTYDERRQVLTVKSMLYLLEGAIAKPLDIAVLTRLRLLEPEMLIKHWQANCEQMNQHFRPLFEAELKKTRVPQAEWGNHNQLIDLTDAIKRCVHLRLDLLSNWLHSYSTQPKTGLRLLKALDKAVAFSYQSLLGKVKTPQDFYQKLDRAAYKLSEAKTVGRGKIISTTTCNQIKQNSLTPERLQRSLDLDEAYFAHIDFSKLADPAEQVFVLKMLQTAIDRNQPFTYLNLSGCTVINEQELFALLQKTLTLKALHLANCPQFSLATIFNLLNIKRNERVVGFFRWDYDVLCPQLKTLRVTVESKVQQLTLAASLTSRQQLLAFAVQWQAQFNRYWAKLLTSLKDKEFEVRASAYEGLVALTPSLPEAQVVKLIQILHAGLKDNEWYVRAAACQGLVTLAPKIPEVQVEGVIQILQVGSKDEDLSVRQAACQGLVALAPSLTDAQVISVMQILQAGLKDNFEYVRQAACQGLVALAPRLTEAQVMEVIQTLQAKLKYAYSSLQEAACQGLVALAPRVPEVQIIEVMQTLQTRSKDKDSSVREAVCQGLVALVPSLPEAQVIEVIQTLQARSKDEYLRVRVAACQGIMALVPRVPEVQIIEVMQTLQARLKDENPIVQAAACQGLVTLAPKIPEVQVIKFFQILQAGLKESLVVRERQMAYQVLAALAHRLTDAQVIEFFQTLQAGFKEEHLIVREAACQGLVALAPSLTDAQVIEVMQTLQAKLKDENWEIRAVACKGLVALAPRVPKVGMIEVIQTLQAGLKDNDWYVRAAACQELVALAPRVHKVDMIEVIRTLQAGLKDNDWYVRAAACQGLIRLVQSVAGAQANIVIEKLLPLLNDKDINVRTLVLKNLANVYAAQIQLRLLKRAIVKSYAVANDETFAEQLFAPLLQQKILSFLDSDTLFKLIPCINKDWQRWQQAYLQQQDELLREQKSAILKSMPQDDREHIQTGFQHFLQPDGMKLATKTVQIKLNDPREVKTNLTALSEVASKKVNLAQTYFYAKPTPIPLAKFYTVQIAHQVSKFELKAVAGDGDCGYTAFGITRTQVYQLFVEHLDKISPLIKPALQEALRTQAFINWLQRKEKLTEALSIVYVDYLNASQGGEMLQAVLDALNKTGEDLTILFAYIEYDVKEKQIDAGWSHPCILFALAEIQGIELHIWLENAQDELIPHPYYAQHIPAHATQRTDLLFVNGNHFERLEQVTGSELIHEASNTNIFSAL